VVDDEVVVEDVVVTDTTEDVEEIGVVVDVVVDVVVVEVDVVVVVVVEVDVVVVEDGYGGLDPSKRARFLIHTVGVSVILSKLPYTSTPPEGFRSTPTPGSPNRVANP
jgi:hypothetical protein